MRNCVVPTWRVLGLLVLLGCGEAGPELGEVTGRVTLDGEPVTVGTVRFWPASGRPAAGDVDADGRYVLTTFKAGDGALLGGHKVTVESMVAEETTMPQINSLEQEMAHFSDLSQPRIRQARLRWLVPERYSHPGSSGLTADVAPGDNEINFLLNTSPQ